MISEGEIPPSSFSFSSFVLKVRSLPASIWSMTADVMLRAHYPLVFVLLIFAGRGSLHHAFRGHGLMYRLVGSCINGSMIVVVDDAFDVELLFSVVVFHIIAHRGLWSGR